MLLQRYSNIEYVLNLDWDFGAMLINKAYEKNSERFAWERWLVELPHMTEETFTPFTEYFKKMKVKPKAKSKLLPNEIIAKAEELRLAHQGLHEGIKRGEEDGNI